MTEIIQVREKHIREVQEIEYESISPPWSEGNLLCEIFSPDSDFIGAAQDGVLLGFAVLHRTGDDAELYQIAVRGDMRRRGTGDMLMKAVMDAAKEKRYSKLFLEVRASNTPAVALYEKYGLKRAGIRKNYYDSPVEDAVVMVWEASTDC